MPHRYLSITEDGELTRIHIGEAPHPAAWCTWTLDGRRTAKLKRLISALKNDYVGGSMYGGEGAIYADDPDGVADLINAVLGPDDVAQAAADAQYAAAVRWQRWSDFFNRLGWVVNDLLRTLNLLVQLAFLPFKIITMILVIFGLIRK